MPKLGTFASRDTVRQTVVTLLPPGSSEKVPLAVGFYPNRLTMEPTSNGHMPDEWAPDARSDVAQQAWHNAVSFCDTVANWDLEGELCDGRGMVVVDEGVPVPLNPETLVFLPTWIITQVTERLLDLAFPNRQPSNPVRRR